MNRYGVELEYGPRPDWSAPQPLLCGASQYKYNGTVTPKTPRCELEAGHPDHSPGNSNLHVGRRPGGQWVAWPNKPIPPLTVRPPTHTRKPSISELKRRLGTAERNLAAAQAARHTAWTNLTEAQKRDRQ